MPWLKQCLKKKQKKRLWGNTSSYITLLNESVFFLSSLFWIFILLSCSSLTLKRPYLNFYGLTFLFVLLLIHFYLILLVRGCAGAFLQLWQLEAVLQLLRGLPIAAASRAQAQQLWHTGLAPPRRVGSFLIRDRAHVSCFGRQILYHWATREALILLFF